MQSSQVIWSRVNQVVYISLTGLMLLNRWAHRQPGSVKHTTCNITFMHPTICSKVRIYFALKVLSIVLWHICLKLYYDASSKSSFVATVIIWFAWWTREKKGVKFDYPGNHFFWTFATSASPKKISGYQPSLNSGKLEPTTNHIGLLWGNSFHSRL